MCVLDRWSLSTAQFPSPLSRPSFRAFQEEGNQCCTSTILSCSESNLVRDSSTAVKITVTVTQVSAVVILLTACVGVRQCMRGKMIYYVILTIERTGRREINPLTTVLYRDGELCVTFEWFAADVVLAIMFSSILFSQHSTCIEQDEIWQLSCLRIQSFRLRTSLFLQELHR